MSKQKPPLDIKSAKVAIYSGLFLVVIGILLLMAGGYSQSPYISDCSVFTYGSSNYNICVEGNRLATQNWQSSETMKLIGNIVGLIALLFGGGVALRGVSLASKLSIASRNAIQETAPLRVDSAEGVSSIEVELEKASSMLAKGLIDEEEYKALKKKIIERS